MTRNPTPSDHGETLVEILVALAILSVGVVAMIGALTTNVTTSVVNRSQAKAESALLAASEYVKSLPFASTPCSGGPVSVTTAQVPRDAAFAVTYGPSAQVGTTPCSTLVRVPVTVTGDGYTMTMDVVKRP